MQINTITHIEDTKYKIEESKQRGAGHVRECQTTGEQQELSFGNRDCSKKEEDGQAWDGEMKLNNQFVMQWMRKAEYRGYSRMVTREDCPENESALNYFHLD